MLTVEDIRCLERLTLAHSQTQAAAGSRHARTRGHGLEFRDYRHYQPGDDPRLIDWTVDARLRQLVVRVFRAEGQLRLHVLLDTSASMGVGAPTSKLACAARLAAALAYVAVERRDSLGLTTFDSTIGVHLQSASGRPQLFRTLEALQMAEARGPSDIEAALTSFATIARGPGLALVLSDFLDQRHTFEGLQLLIYRGLVPALIQVVADEDLDPDLQDEAELVDAEHADAMPMVADRSVVNAYRERLARVTDSLRDFSLTHHLPWMQLRSSMSLDAILAACMDAGLVAVHA
jgi:uncharacterized protein (DUF58 family)